MGAGGEEVGGEVLHADEGVVDFEEEGGHFLGVGDVLGGEAGHYGLHGESCFGRSLGSHLGDVTFPGDFASLIRRFGGLT